MFFTSQSQQPATWELVSSKGPSIGCKPQRFTRIATRSNKYPFSEGMLGGKLAAGTGLSVHCFGCQRCAVLDVAQLVGD
ncbi:hypothetical protein MPLA_2130007 [Mesorhizobium sp. ORS 3359]|nr:hypothetical protein MPLA_2130007 [Mesorhizobium sp. ORS 3359]